MRTRVTGPVLLCEAFMSPLLAPSRSGCVQHRRVLADSTDRQGAVQLPPLTARICATPIDAPPPDESRNRKTKVVLHIENQKERHHDNASRP